MTSKTKKSVRYTAYALFTLLFLAASVLAIEVYARFQNEYGRAGFVFSEDLIYHLNPNLVAKKAYAWGKVGKPPFTLRFNKQGFRGPNFKRKKKANKKRILVIGDSFTAGLDYPDEEIFSSLWLKQLNANGTEEYEILNASCPAWGADQEYLFWKQQGQYLNADHVVIMMSPNDIREAWNHNIVRYDEKQQNLTTRKAELPYEEERGWYWASKSSLFQLLQKEYYETNYGDFFRVFWYFPVHYGKEDSTDWNRPLFLKEPFQEVEDSYDLMEKMYAAIQRDCHEQGGKLHLVKLPILQEIDTIYQDTSLYNRSIVEERITALANRQNIPFYNLNIDLRQHPDPKSIFMHWDPHYDEGGHQWIADMLTKHIQLD